MLSSKLERIHILFPCRSFVPCFPFTLARPQQLKTLQNNRSFGGFPCVIVIKNKRRARGNKLILASHERSIVTIAVLRDKTGALSSCSFDCSYITDELFFVLAASDKCPHSSYQSSWLLNGSSGRPLIATHLGGQNEICTTRARQEENNKSKSLPRSADELLNFLGGFLTFGSVPPPPPPSQLPLTNSIDLKHSSPVHRGFLWK